MFCVLETFQMLLHTGKVLAHEFVIALERCTNNTLTANVRVRTLRDWEDNKIQTY